MPLIGPESAHVPVKRAASPFEIPRIPQRMPTLASLRLSVVPRVPVPGTGMLETDTSAGGAVEVTVVSEACVPTMSKVQPEPLNLAPPAGTVMSVRTPVILLLASSAETVADHAAPLVNVRLRPVPASVQLLNVWLPMLPTAPPPGKVAVSLALVQLRVRPAVLSMRAVAPAVPVTVVALTTVAPRADDDAR